MWQEEVPLPTSRALTFPMFFFMVVIALLVFAKWLGAGEELGIASNRQDLMYYSGFLVVLPTLLVSLGLDKRFRDLLIQLREDIVMKAPPETWDEAYVRVRKTCRRWQVSGALMVGLAVFFTFDFAVLPGVSGYVYACIIQNNACESGPRYISFLVQESHWSFSLFVLASIILGVLAGQRLGTMAGISRSITTSLLANTNLEMQPRHTDKTGGFARMGSLIAVQGVLAAVPLIFLTSFLVLIYLRVEQGIDGGKAIDFGRYARWSSGFLVQTIVALVFVFLCFVLPFFQVQTVYRRERERTRLVALSVDLEDLSEVNRTEHVSLLEAIRCLPASPVVPSLNFTFTLSNATPYFLIAASMLVPERFKKLAEVILENITG